MYAHRERCGSSGRFAIPTSPQEAARQNVGTNGRQQPKANSQESEGHSLQSESNQVESGNDQEEPGINPEESGQPQHHY
jgi:hypothetical protein